MFLDPLTQWEDGFPYTVLAEVGITPASSLADIKEVSFDLIERGMSPERRLAWDTLRFPERRLVIDFFLYRFLPDTSTSAQEKSHELNE